MHSADRLEQFVHGHVPEQRTLRSRHLMHLQVRAGEHTDVAEAACHAGEITHAVLVRFVFAAPWLDPGRFWVEPVLPASSAIG